MSKKQDRINWYVDQRRLWIAESLRVYGYINREHISRKFGTSIVQSSLDLKHFVNKGIIRYNVQLKHFELVK